MTKSRAIAKKTAAIFVSVIVIGSGIYVLRLYETGRPPFCSGYPPGGDCPGNYSNAFQISVNYTGSWRATYYAYHSVAAPPDRFSGIGNYTGGSHTGTGPSLRTVTLSGPSTNGLAICVRAEKLDSSGSVLTPPRTS